MRISFIYILLKNTQQMSTQAHHPFHHLLHDMLLCSLVMNILSFPNYDDPHPQRCIHTNKKIYISLVMRTENIPMNVGRVLSWYSMHPFLKFLHL